MRYPEKIYEQAKDLHVRNIVLYNVNDQIAYDSDGTKLLSKEEIVDAFLKGCVVNNNGSYITPTGVNVDGDTATLVFDGGGSSELPPEVTNAVETHGMGWTSEGIGDIVWDGDTTGLEVYGNVYYKVSSATPTASDLLGETVGYSSGESIVISNDILQDYTETYGAMLVASEAGAIYFINNSELFYNIDGDYLSTGIYFFKSGGRYVSLLTGDYIISTVNKINSEYIPITAGNNISISNGVISSKLPVYNYYHPTMTSTLTQNFANGVREIIVDFTGIDFDNIGNNQLYVKINNDYDTEFSQIPVAGTINKIKFSIAFNPENNNNGVSIEVINDGKIIDYKRNPIYFDADEISSIYIQTYGGVDLNKTVYIYAR